MPSAHALCCPHCYRPLAQFLLQAVECCPECGSSIANRAGVIDFMTAQDFNRAEGSHGGGTRANQPATAEGRLSSAHRAFSKAPEQSAYFTDPGRLGWLFHCYNENSHEACLCLASGWGSLVFPLSRFYSTVYSVDQAYERLHHQASRAAAEGIDNLCILRSPLLRLPLQDQSVDLVLIGDILKWIGLNDLDRDPDAIREQFLREVNRVLKPGGQLYIGTENRFGAYHGLKAASWKLLAGSWKLVARASGQQPAANSQQPAASQYHTHTYSAWGYEDLLHRSGFSQTSLYWVWPSYHYPRMSGSLDGESIRYMMRKFEHQAFSPWLRLLIKLGTGLPTWLLGLLIRSFSPHFLIVASPQPAVTTLQARILARTPRPHSFVRLTMGVNAGVKTTFLLLDKKSRVSKAVRVVEHTENTGSLKTFVSQESEGLAGHPIRPHNQGDIQAVAAWLARFHRASTIEDWQAEALVDEIDHLIQRSQRFAQDAKVSGLLQVFAERYERFVRAEPLPVTAEHGDFTTPNIMIVANQVQVIDWEFSREQGNPLMDVGAFCLSLLRSTSAQGLFPKVLRANTSLALFAQAYSRDWRLPIFLAPSYYLLRQIDRISSQEADEEVIQVMLSHWIPLLRPTLEFSLVVQERTPTVSQKAFLRSLILEG